MRVCVCKYLSYRNIDTTIDMSTHTIAIALIQATDCFSLNDKGSTCSTFEKKAEYVLEKKEIN